VTSHPPKILNTNTNGWLTERKAGNQKKTIREACGWWWAEWWCDGREGSARGGRERLSEGARGAQP
jgi:hypothetical protein